MSVGQSVDKIAFLTKIDPVLDARSSPYVSNQLPPTASNCLQLPPTAYNNNNNNNNKNTHNDQKMLFLFFRTASRPFAALIVLCMAVVG
jgi:hypothetical protein